jgi:hypothetical protein
MGKQRLSDPSQRKGFSKKSRSANIAPIIFLGVISLALAVGLALLLRENFQAREMKDAVIIERNECQQRADQMLVQLNELDAAFVSLSAQNTELQQLSEQQRREISRLRAQIRSVAGTQQIEDVKARIEQLELELAEYQQQAQILFEENTQLSGEQARIKNSLASAEEQVVELGLINQGLTNQVEQASELKIINIQVVTTRQVRRGEKETTRANRVDKIQACFTILDNKLAQPGNRDFYVRITGPNNQLLTNRQTGNFNLAGNQMPYTATRAFDYKNAQLIGCIPFTPATKLEKGVYRVAVYTEGREVGTQVFELD